MQKIKRYFFNLLLCVCLGNIVCLYAADLPDFTKLVEQSSPAVVNISSTKKIATKYRMPPDWDEVPPMFRDFFRQQTPIDPQSQQTQSLGSGFIISADGYILTNNHVVQGADEIIVKLSDRSELKAKLIGADPQTDIALLKVADQHLPHVKIGKSTDLKVGEWVMAIGSPFGFDHSVTVGIVSAKGRSLGVESNYVPFIQTDVAINPGNSGGPLFNLQGEVVGINSQILTRSGGFMGLSFAIPIDVAMSVADQLKANGQVDRAWLGIMIQEVNKDLAESFGLDKPAGALVVQILKEGPAAKSALQVGDIVLSVNGQTVERSADLPHIIGLLKPGETVALRIIRNGIKQDLNMATGTLPNAANAVAKASMPNSQKANLLGVIVADLTAPQKQALGVNTGVIIQGIQTGGLAHQIGLRTNDVITHLNNRIVGSAVDFQKAINELPKDKMIAMGILREGYSTFITFKLTR